MELVLKKFVEYFDEKFTMKKDVNFNRKVTVRKFFLLYFKSRYLTGRETYQWKAQDKMRAHGMLLWIMLGALY